MRVEKFLQDLTINIDYEYADDIKRLEVIKAEFVQRFNLVSGYALDTLSTQVCKLYYIDDRSIKDISLQLGIEASEVKKIKTKAVRACSSNARWRIMYDISPYFDIYKYNKNEYDLDMSKKLSSYMSDIDISTINNNTIDYFNFSNKTQNFLLKNRINTVGKLLNKSCNKLKTLNGATNGVIHEILFKFSPRCKVLLGKY